MQLPSFSIESRRRGEGGKTRAFSVHLMGYATADALWESGGGSGSPLRPVWLAFVGTDAACRAVAANLRSGRTATAGGERFGMPKKIRFRWLAQRGAEATITVAYLPELFGLEPAGTAPVVRFVLAPSRRWLLAQAEQLRGEFGEGAHDAARAALFCAYLDRRTPLPIVRDLGFQLRLYRAARAEGWLSPPREEHHAPGPLFFRLYADCGLDTPLACQVLPDRLAGFLAQETSAYHAQEIRDGKTRIAGARRLLPHAPGASAQLRFDFEVA
jgi:hypothetical protein